MFKWYWEATACYAYLTDVFAEHSDWKKEVEMSRWFTRGWTLQELLVPDIVEFYDKFWEPLGTKSRIVTRIQKATRIEPRFLLSRETIRDATVATKFSWASLRQTTRVEDMAYCLPGLVGVNMPMLYGEGDRAFYRLQLEIIRQNNEHIIFAWEPPAVNWSMTAVLAPSPTYFERSAEIHPSMLRKTTGAGTHEITNNGLRITLPCIRFSEDRVIASLNCGRNPNVSIRVWLEKVGHDKYQRLPGSKLVNLNVEEEDDTELVNMYLVVSNDNHGGTSRNTTRMTVGSVLTDGMCIVNSVVVSSRQRPGRTNAFTPSYHRRSQEESNTYLLKSLSVAEGEAASLRLYYCKPGDSKRAEHKGSYHIVFGLRNGRAMARLISQGPFIYADILRNVEEDWSEDMHLNPHGNWDSAGDYVQSSMDSMIIKMTARKKVVKKERLWTLVIRMFRCQCNAVDGTGEDCICDAKSRAVNHLQCFCAECKPRKEKLSQTGDCGCCACWSPVRFSEDGASDIHNQDYIHDPEQHLAPVEEGIQDLQINEKNTEGRSQKRESYFKLVEQLRRKPVREDGLVSS